MDHCRWRCTIARLIDLGGDLCRDRTAGKLSKSEMCERSPPPRLRGMGTGAEGEGDGGGVGPQTDLARSTAAVQHVQAPAYGHPILVRLFMVPYSWLSGSSSPILECSLGHATTLVSCGDVCTDSLGPNALPCDSAVARPGWQRIRPNPTESSQIESNRVKSC